MPLLKRYSFIFVVIISTYSCHKVLIKPDPTSDSEKNFEMFWNDVHNGYPYFEEDKIDWKARYDAVRPSISKSTSTVELYTKMTSMLTGFSDGHLNMEYGGMYYGNEKTITQFLKLVKADANGTELPPSMSSDYASEYYNRFDQINKGYINPNTYQSISTSSIQTPGTLEEICYYGLIKDQNILYVNLTTFLTEYPFDELLQSIFAQYPLAQGLIIDLRMNGGGNLGTMWDALSVFLPLTINEVKYGYSREKVGPLPQNFGPEKYFAVSRHNASPPFLKPVVLLANKRSISAAEHATMAMREIKKYNKQIKIVGDYTFGATSFIVERTLPNGITYTLVNSKTWDINRVVVERTGVKPDEIVYITSDNVLSNTDSQLERAMEIILKNQF